LEKRQSQKKRREIVDWRKTDNGFSAFIKGKLMSNDYQIIFSLIAAHVSLIVMCVLIWIYTDSVFGITVAVPFLHYFSAAFSLAKTLSTDSPMTVPVYIFFFLAYAI